MLCWDSSFDVAVIIIRVICYTLVIVFSDGGVAECVCGGVVCVWMFGVVVWRSV